MNTGIFGEGFPYSNFHDLNMDWIIKIAKDFLDQYTHIQEIIETGKTDIQELTASGLEQLQDKADALEELLQEWYNTHSEDIANQLADALEDLNEWYTEHSEDIADELADALTALNNWYTTHENYLDQTLADNISAFNASAEAKASETIATIPEDYTELVKRNINITNADRINTVVLTDGFEDGWIDDYGQVQSTGNYKYAEIESNFLNFVNFTVGTGSQLPFVVGVNNDNSAEPFSPDAGTHSINVSKYKKVYLNFFGSEYIPSYNLIFNGIVEKEISTDTENLVYCNYLGYVDANGDFSAYNGIYCAWVALEKDSQYYLTSNSFYGMARAVVYGANGELIKIYHTASDDTLVENTEIEVPETAKFVLIQSYKDYLSNTKLTKKHKYIDSTNNTFIEKTFKNVTDELDFTANIGKLMSTVTVGQTLTYADGANYYRIVTLNVSPGDVLEIGFSNLTHAGVPWAITKANGKVSRRSFVQNNQASGTKNYQVIYIQNNETTIHVQALSMLYFRKLTGRTFSNEYAYYKIKNKKIAFNGDSICESRFDATYNGGAYPKIISDITGCKFDNRAVGGAVLVSSGATGVIANHRIVEDIVNMPTDADMICLEGGLNDYFQNAVLGTFSPTDYTGTLDETTILGALESIIRQSLSRWVGKPICFVFVHRARGTKEANTQGYTFAEQVTEMKKVLNKYAIPYYDAFNESGLTGYTDSQVTTFLNAGASGADGIHPNEQAYKIFYVPQMIALLEKLVPVD